MDVLSATEVTHTEAPKPTDAPHTEAPKPTDAPHTEAPTPTDAPHTEAPQPTDAPHTDEPQPTDAPHTEAPKPTDAPHTEGPKPTDAPHTDEPTPTDAPQHTNAPTDATIHDGSDAHVINGNSGGEMHSDSANDVFVFGDVSGHANVHGHSSGNWTDVIEIDTGHGPAVSAAHGNWTVEIDGQKIVDGHAHGSIDTHGHTGSITSDHGTINFDHIDKIQW